MLLQNGQVPGPLPPKPGVMKPLPPSKPTFTNSLTTFLNGLFNSMTNKTMPPKTDVKVEANKTSHLTIPQNKMDLVITKGPCPP